MNIVSKDKVVVLSGKDKGKRGEVLRVDPKAMKAVVSGVSVATKHRKARKQGQQSEIVKMETPIYTCKLMVVCPKCDKPTRVGHAFDANGKKFRACKHCGASL